MLILECFSLSDSIWLFVPFILFIVFFIIVAVIKGGSDED